MLNENTSPIVVRRRKGTAEDPFINVEEFLTVTLDGKVTLSELPERYTRVVVKGEDITWTEIEDGTLDNDNYIVSYNNKLVTFNKEHVGKQLKFIYRGTGLEYVPASVIYTKLEDGEVIETLDGLLTGAVENIDKINDALEEIEGIQGEIVNNSNNAKINAEYAKNQGDYAKEKGTLADEKAKLVEKVVNEATTVKNEMKTVIDNSIFLGEYNATREYLPNNLVRFEHALYRNLKKSIGIHPKNTTNWVQYLSVKDMIDQANLKLKEMIANNAVATEKIKEVTTSISNANIAITQTEKAKQDAITATGNTITATKEAKEATNKAIEATTGVITATEDAIKATDNANSKALLAQEKANLANEKAMLADEKAKLAETATINTNKSTEDSIKATGNAIKATSDAVKATEETIAIKNSAVEEIQKIQTFLSSLTFKGEYNSNAQYKVHNVVTYENAIYVCINDAKNVSPDTTSHWKKYLSVKEIIDSANQAIVDITLKSEDIDKAVEDVNVITENFRFMGEWNNTTSYKVFNQVRHNGSTYMCIRDNVNTVVFDEAVWQLSSIKGLDGDVSGVNSLNGMTGEVVINADSIGAIPNSKIGIADGVARLNADGKVIDSNGDLVSGQVESVNGQTGKVALVADDVNAYTKSETDEKVNKGIASIPLASDIVDGKMSIAQYVKLNSIPLADTIETVTGSQDKVDAHANDTDKHITREDRKKWDEMIPLTQKGKALGVATLNADGKVIDSEGNLIEGKVKSVNTQVGDVILTASDVGALPDSTKIPTKVSEITNDKGFITTSEADVALKNYITASEADTKLKKYVEKSQVGVANGLAKLNADGKVVDKDGNLVEGKVTSVNGQIGDVIIDNNSITKLAKFYYDLTATEDNQKIFEIPLDSFDNENDYILVVQNSTVLSKERFTIDGVNITLNEGVDIGDSVYLSIIKQVITIDENEIIPKHTHNALDIVDLSTVLDKYSTVEELNLHKNNEEIHVTNEEKIKIANAIQNNEKGIPNGVAILDSNGKILSSQIDVDLSTVATTEEVSNLSSIVTAHNNDDTLHIPYVVASGVANVYTALIPNVNQYTEGMALSVKINIQNTGVATIDVNGLGAKNIIKGNGNAVSSGNLKVNSIYTLRYNGTSFILQGEGGEGTALVADVLSGKTFTNDDGTFTGTMANRSGVQTAVSRTVSGTTLRLHPNPGYYPGGSSNYVQLTDSNFTADNIMSGVSIFGLSGRGGLRYYNSYKNIYPSSSQNYGKVYSTNFNIGFPPKYYTIRVDGLYVSDGSYNYNGGMMAIYSSSSILNWTSTGSKWTGNSGVPFLGFQDNNSFVSANSVYLDFTINTGMYFVDPRGYSYLLNLSIYAFG